MKDNRDALDYGEMRVSKLFYKLFFPTLLGLLSSVLLNLADGIFVGQGVGSNALAAINIAAPMFLVSTGIALMFGSGASIVAAVHLSKGNRKAANINVTQAFTVGLLLMLTIVVIVNVFPRQTAALFGGSEALYPLVHDYLFWVSPCFCFMIINIVGTFAIRLDTQFLHDHQHTVGTGQYRTRLAIHLPFGYGNQGSSYCHLHLGNTGYGTGGMVFLGT